MRRERLLLLYLALCVFSMGVAAATVPESFVTHRHIDLYPQLRRISAQQLPRFAALSKRYAHARNTQRTVDEYVRDAEQLLERDYETVFNHHRVESVFLADTSRAPLLSRYYTLYPRRGVELPTADPEIAWSEAYQNGLYYQEQIVNDTPIRLLYADLPLPRVLAEHHYEAGLVVYWQAPQDVVTPNPAKAPILWGIFLSFAALSTVTWWWLRPVSAAVLAERERRDTAEAKLAACDELIAELEGNTTLHLLRVGDAALAEYRAGLELRARGQEMFRHAASATEVADSIQILSRALAHLQRTDEVLSAARH